MRDYLYCVRIHVSGWDQREGQPRSIPPVRRSEGVVRVHLRSSRQRLNLRDIVVKIRLFRHGENGSSFNCTHPIPPQILGTKLPLFTPDESRFCG